MRNERGFSLIEMLVVLLILAIVITTTIEMFAERQKRMRQATEMMIAYQVLSNEVEWWRRLPLTEIDKPENQVFQTSTALLAPLAPFATAVKVDKTNDDVRQVTLTVRWQNGNREAKLAFARVNLGGSHPGDTPLW